MKPYYHWFHDARRAGCEFMRRRRPLTRKPHVRIIGAKCWQEVQVWLPIGRGYELYLTAGPRAKKSSHMAIAKELCDRYEAERRR
jgi:hypothetical protein